jgi:hypothetical protein
MIVHPDPVSVMVAIRHNLDPGGAPDRVLQISAYVKHV